jgi:photosystem II stability/assembly factor-like uncharacterized protein
MNPYLFPSRLAMMALLALGIVGLVPHKSLGEGENNLPEERAKQIADLEKKLADLQAQIKALKDGHEQLPAPRSLSEVSLPVDWAKAFSWRSIGPATMGGRITGLAVAADDPSTYWIATASGGLLKTTNNGTTFEHQFDKEATVSLGAVAVAPSNKNIVWAGTGENNPRNSVSYGDGVYKSDDGGKTWKNMGLKGAFQIGSIVIHPKDPNIVYVGALGRCYGVGGDRGLYKTTDAGKNWERVLFVDDRTGVIDIAMHPTDPETLIVATWERQRDEFDSFRGDAKSPPAADVYAPAKVHGPGSGLWKTTNGGASFERLTKGLPTVDMGRIGLNYSHKNPNTIFAVIDTVDAGKGVPPSTAYMGIQGETVKETGAKLTAITEGGPAEKAGLQKDDVVIAFDGKEVKSYEALVEALRAKKPNDKVKLTVLRGKEKKDIEVTLGDRQEAGGGGRRGGPGGVAGKGGGPGGQGGQGQRASLGVQIEEVEGGLRITEVTPQGPAEKAGLKQDDIIVTIDGTEVTDQRVIFKLLFGKQVGDTVKVAFLRGKEKKDAEVRLDIVPPGRPGRPYSGGSLGGQQANVQSTQGPDGWQTGGVYKSTDNGASWTRINSLNERPFYFSVIRVDPSDDNILFAAGVNLWHSTDGGKTFTSQGVNGGLHSDQHAIWINPKDGRHMLIGTDGGFYVTFDRAAHWQHLNKLALGQFYHVAVDNRLPYRVYGGLQDNGSWGGPSQTPRTVGPINEDWNYVNGGDGFVCGVDWLDPDEVYAESQDGNMMRRNMRTGDSKVIRPRSRAGLGTFRWNWNTPFLVSHHNPRIFYCAANYVFRSVKQGDDLHVISPEITRTKRGTGTAVAESPRNPDILWAGTDDGAVWVTRDGGRNWANISDRFAHAGLPGSRWVASIEPSKAVDGRCYVVFDAHRSNDDEPYVFLTEDFGETWKSLRANLPGGSTRVLREDIVNPNLLYLGTEFAAWASIDRGASWTKINGEAQPEAPEPKAEAKAEPKAGDTVSKTEAKAGEPASKTDPKAIESMKMMAAAPKGEPKFVGKGRGPGAGGGARRGGPPTDDTRITPLPTVAVHEFAQPTTANEIVAATHGRSLWVLDVTALRQMTTEVVKAGKPVLFDPETVVRWQMQPGRQVPFSEAMRKFIGQNPPRVAFIEYVLPQKANRVTVKIMDIAGKTVRDLSASADAGYHRVPWDLRRVAGVRQGIIASGASEAEIAASPFGRMLLGPDVAPGAYRVVLTVDGADQAKSLVIEPDPTAPREALVAEDEAEEDLAVRKEMRKERNSMGRSVVDD